MSWRRFRKSNGSSGLWAIIFAVVLASPIIPSNGASFSVQVYTSATPPPTPALQDLPLLTQVTQDGITWTFSQPQRVGRFVNGDYYVVGPVTVTDIQPLPTSANGRHGSMLNIKPNVQVSGFDSRITDNRYDASLRVYPPISLTPGNKLVSSRSIDSSYLPRILRPDSVSESPVASVSILTSVAAPLPPDAFRPSYARGSTNIYYSRNLKRQILPRLAPVQHVPTFAEFEGYLRRPWIDSVFFGFDFPAEYMPAYGREIGFITSFSSLLLTLDVPEAQKEPLLVYLVQYGIDLNGLVEQGHNGWPAFGGHGNGRKFPALLARLLLGLDPLAPDAADFGEDLHTIWVTETPPAGTYTKSWHSVPQTVVWAGMKGINGEASRVGGGPYEHLTPDQWKTTEGEEYRRCCSSITWVGEALAARLISGMRSAWNHPQFFAYVDRWMFVPDDPRDITAVQTATGWTIDSDFKQGQAWRVLAGGGYAAPHRTFADEMWTAYRNHPRITSILWPPGSQLTFSIENLSPAKTNLVQVTTSLNVPNWLTVATNMIGSDNFTFTDQQNAGNSTRFYRVIASP
jgi:hypothetical protein